MLSTKEPNVVAFYASHPEFDFDSVNIWAVEWMNNILRSSSKTSLEEENKQLQKCIHETRQSLHWIQDSMQNSFQQSNNHIEGKVQEMKSSLETFQNMQQLSSSHIQDNLQQVRESLKHQYETSQQSLVSSLTTMKHEYLLGVKTVVQEQDELSLHKTRDDLNHQLETQTEHMQTKIERYLTNLFPQQNSAIIEQLVPIFNELRETCGSLKNSSGVSGVERYIQEFEAKYSQLMQTAQQPLCHLIETTETRLQSNINTIETFSKDTSVSNAKLVDDFQGFLAKYHNSSLKGQMGESKLSSVLTELFPTSEIVNTSGERHSGDFMVKRHDRQTILFENKDYERNVPPDEIKKFIRDIEENDCHGVFLSQNSGITSKSNYHIDIHKGNVLVYVHHTHFDPVKIRAAVEIVDHITATIDKNAHTNNELQISSEDLESINREYKLFIDQKDTLVNLIKDCTRRITNQIGDLQLPSLEKYLSSQFASVKSSEFVCQYCNSYVAKNQRALKSHQRGCLRKAAHSSGTNNQETDVEKIEDIEVLPDTEGIKNHVKP